MLFIIYHHACSLGLKQKMGHDVQEVAKLRLEKVLYCLWMVANILFLHELVLWILDEFSEADHQAPRVWTLCLQALQEYACNLLLNNFSSCFCENEKDDAREVERMVVGVPELVDDCVEEVQSGLIVKSVHYEFKSISVFDTLILLTCLVGNE